MILFHYKSKVKCSVAHLHKCMTDISYLKSEIKLENNSSGQNIRVNYDPSSPFSVGNKIVINGASSRMTITIQENQPPDYLQMVINPVKKVQKLMGIATIKISIQSQGDYAKYNVSYTSDKEVTGVAKLYIKILALILKASNWSANRRFIKYAESTQLN